jgi:hypothetical protein
MSQWTPNQTTIHLKKKIKRKQLLESRDSH